jgi:hypothetical protein
LHSGLCVAEGRKGKNEKVRQERKEEERREKIKSGKKRRKRVVRVEVVRVGMGCGSVVVRVVGVVVRVVEKVGGWLG